MSDTLRATFRRMFRLENRRAAVRAGSIERIAGFESKVLGNEREVTVYLPPGYDERENTRRYPVLYMQDGQNLFDAHRAYVPGQHWRMQEAADAAIGERTASPLIIVGIDHAGTERIDEYTPTPDPKHKRGGKAGDFGRMLIGELKPLIDERFRTLPDARNTAIGGSSLGGLVSLHLALEHPDIFGNAVAMSPSVWWNDRVVVGAVDRTAGRPRLWLDIGGREGAEALSDVRGLRDHLMSRGWGEGTLRYYEDRRGDHSERAWARRARMPLEFLFPPE